MYDHKKILNYINAMWSLFPVLLMICCLVFEQDEEEPKDEAFSPDGGYIPRILFLGTEGVESLVM